MRNKDFRTHVVDKSAELLKFCIALGLICFLTTKAPDQIQQVINLAAAFILGGGKIPYKNLG